MKTYDEMAQSVFSRRDEFIAKQKKKRKRTAVAFTCLCVAVLVGVGLWQSGIFTPEIQQAEDAIYPGIKDTYGPGEEQTIGDSLLVGEKDYYEPAEDTPYNNGPCIPLDGEEDDRRLKMIESYECGASSAGACYALPQNGKYYFSIPLNAAFEAYGEMTDDTGERIIYRVVVHVFEDGKMVTGKENFVKIAEKFTRIGYKSGIEIPNNRDDLAVLTLHVTEEELKNFPEDKENGYFFFLYNEHDGMGDTSTVLPDDTTNIN